MINEANCPEAQLSVGEKFHGFHVLRVEKISDIRVTAYEIEHDKTGAKIIHLHCDDKENLYAVGFRTPPKDSTGVPHILEHSVLAGSDRYPLKDAFNELIKGTLQTFLNAFTYPDKTVYPVASQERMDFYNLARVYTDLVLKPRLLKETFCQEGHHVEVLDQDDGSVHLMISGIVYNEMKGAYSSPESLLYKSVQENLYNDSDYAHDSGGDPDVIPSLTYEQFKEFHKLYYSPTNARFFIYGDIPTRDHLIFLEEMLAGFDRVAVDSSVRSQARWSEPKSVKAFYPIGKDEDIQGKTYVNLAWMMTENTDYETVVLLEIVSAMLVGSAAGPLRKALIDSGLGQDLSPVTGLERDLKQLCFAVGLRGSEADRASKIEDLIFDTLRAVAQSGFDKDLVEGTLHQIEFHGKEISRGVYPYGIVLMGRAFHTWLYDGDPFVGLHFSKIIEDIRSKWTADPRLFQGVIERWFLNNPHRLLAVMEPSRTYQDDREEAFKRKMAEMKERLSAEEIDRIRTETNALRTFQSEPDSDEAQATLPKLNISDISRAVETIPTAHAAISDAPAMLHDLFTNGIAYLDMAFDISDIPDELLSYLPLLAKLSINMGAAGLTYEEMSKRIALKTGGISCALESGLRADGPGHWQKMIFRVKALYRNIPDAVQILSDIFLKGDMTDENRLKDLILEKKNGLHASVVPSGHVFARRTAGAGLSVPAYLDEVWHGATQLRFINNVAKKFPETKEDLRKKLEFLKEKLFNKKRLLLNLSADQEGLDLLSESVLPLVGRLSGDMNVGDLPTLPLQPRHAGVAVSAQVSYVAQVWPAPTYADPACASLFLASRLLSSGYLYKHIRVQGGAYGGSSAYSPLSGLLAFISYRDPHIRETLKVYREAVESITQQPVSLEDLEKAIIGTIGALDRPMDPSSRGYAAMIREFSGLTDETRKQFRGRILDMAPEKLREDVCRYFPQVLNAGVIAVYSSDENLCKANETLEPKLPAEALV
ncbi:MAG: insulinase family protein [Deltaproteobacteria bacterium]|nr:insulinase family protein [Deltaproteobacteria bacterium]